MHREQSGSDWRGSIGIARLLGKHPCDPAHSGAEELAEVRSAPQRGAHAASV
jgi:hypothetical protein